MAYTVTYRAPECRGAEYTTIFEVAFDDGTIYSVGGSVPCDGQALTNVDAVVKACWADAEKHVTAYAERLAAQAKAALVAEVDLSTVPETVALSKTLVAAKAVDPAPGPDISEEDTPLDGR